MGFACLLMVACGSKTTQTYTESFDSYANAHGPCVRPGPTPEGTDCSEFNTETGPLYILLRDGAKAKSENRQLLIDAAQQETDANRQEAAFWVLRNVLTREEMLPICKRIGQNPDSDLIATVLNYLLEAETANFADNSADSFYLALDIERNTIAKSSKTTNINVAANYAHKLGFQRGEVGFAFFISLKRRLGSGKDSPKVIGRLISQSYNNGFFPKKDILAMRTQVEKKYGSVATTEMFTFANEYANLKD